MKKTIVSIIALAAATMATAQTETGKVSIIPRVGVSVANISGDGIYFGATNNEMFASSKAKTGFTGGIDIEYQFARSLSATLGAHYTQQGCKYGNSTESPLPNVKQYTGYNNISTQIETINIPLLLNYYLAPGFAVKTGVQVGLPLSGKTKWTETDFSENEDGELVAAQPQKHSESLNSSLKKVDFSIPVGLSFEYMNVIIDARYNIGLTNIQKGVVGNTLPAVKNRVFWFSAAYRFEL